MKEKMSWSELKSLIDAVYEKNWMKDLRVDEEACGPDAPQNLIFCQGERKAKICKVVKIDNELLSIDVLAFDTPEVGLAMKVKLLVYGRNGHIYSVSVESVHSPGGYEARGEGWDIPGFTF